MVSRLLHALTDTAVSRRGKFLVIAIWVILTLALSVFAPKLATFYNANSTQSIPATADSQVAQRLLSQKFPASHGTPAILVFSDPGGLSVNDRIHMHTVSDWLTSAQRPLSVGALILVFTVPQAAGQLISPDGTTMMMIAQMQGDITNPKVQQDVQAIRAKLQQELTGSSMQGNLTGPAGILTDVTGVFGSVDLALLFTTVSLVFILLIVLYRSPLLALLPLLAVFLALQITNALLALGAQAGLFTVGQMPAQIATVLLFGAGTDTASLLPRAFAKNCNTRATNTKRCAQRCTLSAKRSPPVPAP